MKVLMCGIGKDIVEGKVGFNKLEKYVIENKNLYFERGLSGV